MMEYKYYRAHARHPSRRVGACSHVRIAFVIEAWLPCLIGTPLGILISGVSRGTGNIICQCPPLKLRACPLPLGVAPLVASVLGEAVLHPDLAPCPRPPLRHGGQGRVGAQSGAFPHP